MASSWGLSLNLWTLKYICGWFLKKRRKPISVRFIVGVLGTAQILDFSKLSKFCIEKECIFQRQMNLVSFFQLENRHLHSIMEIWVSNHKGFKYMFFLWQEATMILQTLQKLRMLSSVTLYCQVTMIVIFWSSQLSEMSTIS